MTKENRLENKKTDKKKKDGEIPRTYSNQNLGHNSKKEGLGPNTNR